MSAPETPTGGRDWAEMGRLARATCAVIANNHRRGTPGFDPLPYTVELDAQEGQNVWQPAVWVLAAATVVELQSELRKAKAALATIHSLIEAELDTEFEGAWADYYAEEDQRRFVLRLERDLRTVKS